MKAMSMGHFNGKIPNVQCAMSRDRLVWGHWKPHICNQRPQFAYSLYDFYEAMMTIKGSLNGGSPIVKWFLAEKILSRQNWATK